MTQSAIDKSNWRRNAIAIVPFAFLFFWCWIIFWNGRVALPTEDQSAVMWERVYSNSDWSFFWNFLSFNRTRLVNPGDTYLFRPGTHAIIAATDIFFREKLIAGGMLSLFFLSLLAGATFHWLSQLSNRSWALLFTLLLVTPFAASKIIWWRHISGYLFCPLFLTLGLSALHRKSFRLAGTFFFAASLFHEAAPLALLVSALLLAIHPNVENRRALLLSFVIPAMLFVCWSTADFLYYRGFQSPFGASSPERPVTGNPAVETLYFVGITVVAHLFPHWVSFEKAADETVFWNFSNVAYGMGIALGIALILLFAVVLRKRRELPTPQWVVPLSLFLVVVLSLVVGRVLPRGWDYLYRSPYYFFFTSWAMTGLFALALQFCSAKIPRLLISVFLTLVTGLSAIQLQKYFEPKSHSELQIALAINETSEVFEEHPDWCYSGSIDPYLHTLDPLIFYRKSCAARAGESMITDLDSHRRLVIKSLPPPPHATVSLSHDSKFNGALNKVLGSPGRNVITPTLSSPSAVALGPMTPGLTGLLFNYETSENFQALFFDQHRVFQVRWNAGKAEPAILVGYFTRNEPALVTLRAIEDRVWMWWGKSLVGQLHKVAALQGRFGALCAPNAPCPETAQWDQARTKSQAIFTSQVIVPEALPQLIPSNY